MEKPQSVGSMVLRLTATEAETDWFASTCRLHASVWLEERLMENRVCLVRERLQFKTYDSNL
jgi:hypothetical protein